MADTDTLLGGVISELQKTNQLLATGNRDPNLASSIKDNPEIQFPRCFSP